MTGSAFLPDGYVVERELGRGGMATVFLARDLKHGRRVAVKVMRPELALVLGAERFQREIRLAAQLQHPHILPVFDSGESAGRLWYTMPFVEGESLRPMLDRAGPLAVDEALRIAREVADALSYSHAQGIVHRDIKPENILFSNGHALVADFGIARVLQDAGGQRLTETGVGIGTAEYMSPEQSLGEDSVDGRSDLYALAAVLYEMLAGEPPFTGPNAQAILAKRMTQPVPSVRTLRETVPESVDAALIRALARTPADRFPNTGEFAAALSAPSVTVGLTHHGSRARWALLALALPVAGAAWYLWHARPAVPGAASVLAVLPFVPTSADTGLVRLGRDLATTIGASLDGVGDIRTVDRLTILSQVPEHGAALALREAAALGRRLGATSVVHGSLAREGARVRLDVGLYTGDSLQPLAQGTVLAAPESLSALTDSVVWQLLQGIWRHGAPPTPTIQAITTRSVEALRAFLDGERLLVAGQPDEARAAFGRAIAADSSFWFAYFRYGNPAGWVDAEADSATVHTYWAHRGQLPKRERLLIEASRLDSGLTRQRQKLDELVHLYPDYSPGWWMLGDQLLHAYPQIGAGPAEARNAFERVVALTPTMVYGWEHLAWAAQEIPDTATGARAVEALDRMGAGPTFVHNEAMDKPLMYRTWLALERRNGSADALLDSAYQSVVIPGRDVFVPSLLLQGEGYPALQIGFNRRLLRHGLPPNGARITSWFIALTWAVRGAWDSALAARDQRVRDPADTLALLRRYQTAVLAAWVGALPPGEAARRRPAAAPLVVGLGPGYRAELAWLDGVLAVAGNDLKGVTASRAALKTSGGVWWSYLDRSLGAFESDLQHDRRTAASAMAALEWELAEGNPYFAGDDATPHVLLRGVDRLAAAQWLQDQGDGTQALRLLASAGSTFEDRIPLAPLAFLLSARIEASLGDTGAARRDYQRFLQRYDMPLPPHRHLVVEAREALARLADTAALPTEH
jgi:serine/threonine-protein kinase